MQILKSPKARIITGLGIILITAALLIWGRSFVAFALSVVDSFNDQTKIAATWNISTSTPGEITIAARTCDAPNWFCSASTTCANYLGDGDYIIVAQGDAPSSKQWKTADTACDQPQCRINGGQTGDNLKADNTLNFTSYPARNYCKSIGARLPTIDELECIYNNRASFGSFAAGNYWSSTEDSETNASLYSFSGGSRGTGHKALTYYVRCVIGW